MNDKKISALIFDVDFNRNETLLFVPETRKSKAIKISINNPISFEKIKERITED